MRLTLLQAAAVLSIVSSASALSDEQKTHPTLGEGSSKVVTYQVQRKPTNSSDPGASKRQIDLSLLDPFYGLSYYVNLEIGTPPQAVIVVLDTGSNELWVNAECSTALSAAQTTWCEANPDYNPATSSTSVYNDFYSPLDLTYGKGNAIGGYYVDNANVGGAEVAGVLFGVATSSLDMAAGIWGVCYGYPLNTDYYTLLDLMSLNGIINSRAFSLDLASVDSNQGAVIFGGIDTMRFSGPLQKMPIIPVYDSPQPLQSSRYWIYMSSFGVTRNGVPVTLSAPVYEQAVYLDSGTSLTFLPANIVANLATHFPEAVLDTAAGLYVVPCTLRSEASTIDFGFGGATIIRVPFHEAIWQVSSTLCVLGIAAAASTGNDWVLGDTMLRGAYVVYDQDNNNLLLAQAANCGSNIIPIGSGVNAVPSVTGACAATTPVSTTSSSKVATTSSALTTIKTTSTSSSKGVTTSFTLTSSKTASTSTSKVTTTSSTLATIKTTSTSSSKGITTSSTLTSSTTTSTSSSKVATTSPTLATVKTTSTSSSTHVATSSSVKTSSSSLTTSSIKLSSSSTSSKATVTVTSAATVTVTETVTFIPTGTCTAKGQVY